MKHSNTYSCHLFHLCHFISFMSFYFIDLCFGSIEKKKYILDLYIVCDGLSLGKGGGEEGMERG